MNLSKPYSSSTLNSSRRSVKWNFYAAKDFTCTGGRVNGDFIEQEEKRKYDQVN